MELMEIIMTLRLVSVIAIPIGPYSIKHNGIRKVGGKGWGSNYIANKLICTYPEPWKRERKKFRKKR